MQEITLSLEQRDEIVKKIINDAIIAERTIKAVNLLVRASDPKEKNWDAECLIHSIYSAFPLMGIPDPKTFEDEEEREPLTGQLWKIFQNSVAMDYSRPELNQSTAHDLAEVILEEWKAYLNNCNLKFKKVG